MDYYTDVYVKINPIQPTVPDIIILLNLHYGNSLGPRRLRSYLVYHGFVICLLLICLLYHDLGSAETCVIQLCTLRMKMMFGIIITNFSKSDRKGSTILSVQKFKKF